MDERRLWKMSGKEGRELKGLDGDFTTRRKSFLLQAGTASSTSR